MGSHPLLQVLQNTLQQLQMVQSKESCIWDREDSPPPVPRGDAAFSTK